MIKKKVLILALLLLVPILFNNSYAMTTCEILNDTHVEQNNPTNNYGVQTTTEIRIHDVTARRSYHLFGNCDSVIIDVLNAEVCFYVGTNAGTDETQIYLVNNSSSINEINMNWNNQPCGTGFNNTSNCNLTIQDEQIVDSSGWFCWNVTNAVNEVWENNETEFAFSLKTYENDTVASSDLYRSKEYINTETRPYLNISQGLETNLNVISDVIFGLGITNLVQANYTLLNDSSLILNATCNLSFDGDSGLMTYDNISLLYEIYVIPEELGILNLTVNCTKESYEPQIENSSTTVFFISGTPYNISVKLFEDLNGSTPYLDEFAYILINAIDYNCSVLTGYNACWRIGEYNNGVAYINDSVAIGNFSVWYYSGELIQECDLCPPVYETLNTVKFLGDFVFDSDRTELYLFVDVFELNFILTLMRFVGTWGLIIVGFVIAFAIAIAVFWFMGKNLGVGILAFILTLWFLMIIGVVPDISDGISLIFS